MNQEQSEVADAYNSIEYWNERYRLHPEVYEWLCSYPSLREYLKVAKKMKVLVVGNGTSTLPIELKEDGMDNITVTDFSPRAIEAFNNLCASSIPTYTLDTLDNIQVEHFKRAHGEFDVIIDKALLDCFAGNRRSLDTVSRYLTNMAKLLRTGGRILIISCTENSLRVPFFKTPHIVQFFTNSTSSPDNNESYLIGFSSGPSQWYLYGLFKIGNGPK